MTMTATRGGWRTQPATDRQVELLDKLLKERTVEEFVDQTGQVNAVVAAYDIIKTDGRPLTKGSASSMIDALLSVKVPKTAKAVATATVSAVTGVSVPEGTYTVVLGEDDDYVTLRIQRATFVKDSNKTMISFLCGPDNDFSYKGFAFVSERGVGVWSRYRSESRIVQAANVLWALAQQEAGLHGAHEEFLKKAEAYAMASGRCARCGKTLTVPASLHRGLGPDCAAKEGVL